MRSDFLNRANADYVDRLFEQYQRDPRSVDQIWQAYFAGFEDAGGRSISREAGEPTTIGVQNLVHSYRELGHFIARLNPLGQDRPTHPLLELSRFGMTEADLDMVVGKRAGLDARDTDQADGFLIAQQRDKQRAAPAS